MMKFCLVLIMLFSLFLREAPLSLDIGSESISTNMKSVVIGSCLVGPPECFGCSHSVMGFT